VIFWIGFHNLSTDALLFQNLYSNSVISRPTSVIFWIGFHNLSTDLLLFQNLYRPGWLNHFSTHCLPLLFFNYTVYTSSLSLLLFFVNGYLFSCATTNTTSSGPATNWNFTTGDLTAQCKRGVPRLRGVVPSPSRWWAMSQMSQACSPSS
jgi:hypothetical protein